MDGKVHQHIYGGLYTVENDNVLSTVDKSRWVVYTHYYPFDRQTWTRPYDEFSDGRFREISTVELRGIMSKHRIAFQQEILENKANSSINKLL